MTGLWPAYYFNALFELHFRVFQMRRLRMTVPKWWMVSIFPPLYCAVVVSSKYRPLELDTMFCLLPCAPGNTLAARLAAGLYLDTGHNTLDTLDTRLGTDVETWFTSEADQIKWKLSQKQCMWRFCYFGFKKFPDGHLLGSSIYPHLWTGTEIDVHMSIVKSLF